MLAFAEKDATVLEWVKQIQASIPNISLPVDASRHKSAEKDPYGTIDFDNELGPYATLSGEENQAEH